MSWRMSVNQRDNTQAAGSAGAVVGATVIAAPKGPTDRFAYIPAGAPQDILDLFGYPSASYPGIQDAIDFNKSAPLYLASGGMDASASKYGGVYITRYGLVPFAVGSATKWSSASVPAEDWESAALAAIPYKFLVGMGDGVKKAFTVNVPFSTHLAVAPAYGYSFDNEAKVALTLTDSALAGTGLASGTYDPATGALTLTFTDAPVANAAIYFQQSLKFTDDEIIGVLNSAFPQSDRIQISMSKYPVENRVDLFKLSMSVYDERYAYWKTLVQDQTVSLLENGVDEDGTPVYLYSLITDENLYLSAYINNPVLTLAQYAAFPAASAAGSSTYFAGGIRVMDEATPYASMATLYALLKNKQKYPVSLIFDTTGEAEVIAALAGLRSSKDNAYTRFVFPAPSTATLAEIKADVSKATQGFSSDGASCIVGSWGKHSSAYSAVKFFSSNMGLCAERYVLCMIKHPEKQPAYYNEDDCGGQLSPGVAELSMEISDDDQRILDDLHLNPVINDPTYGVMIANWRTTYSLNSVYSYVAQATQKDMIISRIIKEVLTPQQAKANDGEHRTAALYNTYSILKDFKAGLDDYTAVCDTSNNTTEVQNNQDFVLSVAVRFKSYARTLKLNFVTTRFGVSVTEALSA